MKKWLIVTVAMVVLGAGGIGAALALTKNTPTAKVYVANESDGTVSVLDAKRKKVLKTIDLTFRGSTKYAAHNVQVSPDNRTVWVTGNYQGGGHEDSHQHSSRLIPTAQAHEGETHSESDDALIMIDSETDTVTRRIQLKPEQHLAHVVLTPDGQTVYAVAQTSGIIYKLSASGSVLKEIAAPAGSQPHGLRVSPDGKTVYIALMAGKAFGVIDVATDAFSQVPLSGQAVQTGVTPDGKYVMATVYDQKQLAVMDPQTKAVRYINLPDAKGPLQVYPSSDSRFAYVADQGHYFNQPVGNRLYAVELAAGAISYQTEVGNGAHGVVVGDDRVYVSNLLDNSVSVVDTKTGKLTSTIAVGKGPNGVSYWTKPKD